MRTAIQVSIAALSIAFAGNCLAIGDEESKSEYIKSAEKTIKKVKRGKVREKDIDKLIAMQNKMIRLAIEGALAHAESQPQDRKMMHLTVLNSERMKRLSLQDIEKLWHAGDYMRSHGIDINNLSHISDAMNYYDAIVHPVTAIIALEQYRQDGDAEHLTQVQDELTEVVMHVEQIGAGNAAH